MNKLREIILSAKRSDFRGDVPHPRKSNSDFIDIKPKILERDNYTCQFCSFYSKKHQHVHHLNDNHDDNTADNLITCCPICHMCHHVGYAGRTGKGTLIYLKQESLGNIKLNITQAKLNSLVRLLWVMEESKENKDTANQAADFLKRFEQARVDADKYLGTCNPMVLGNGIRALSDENYNNRANNLKNIFLLPYKEGYEKEFNYWKANQLKHIASQNWGDIAKNNMFNWVQTTNLPATPQGVRQYLENKRIY